jgi:unsaturated rhamnogalacturonyl hydrolase
MRAKFVVPLLWFAVQGFCADKLYVGLTATGKRMEAFAVEGGPSAAPTVLLLGGLSGQDESSLLVTNELRALEALKPAARPFRLLAIAVANPDKSTLQFPPDGVAYRDNPESNALWRWIALQGPDLVLIAGLDAGLANALSDNDVVGMGAIPARFIPLRAGILKTVTSGIPSSAAHQELYKRRNRTARELAGQLAKVYGHDLDQPVYIQAIALIGQLRLGNLAEVKKLAEPYADGTKDSLVRPTSLHLAGHLVFAALAERTGDPRYTQLVRKAADLGFTESGEMKEAMPFHDEMSDSFFMALPILAKAGKLSGERKYFDMIGRHFDFMTRLDLRADGLYRHSPLTDTAWGRGNAFPALGMALTLSDLPKTDPSYDRILLAFRNQMAALAQFQDEGGMWHEVIDEPASYAETSATSMIAFSMLRGVRNGWLDKAYQARVDRAWRGVLSRVASDGTLIDVCESTNKQETRDDYLHRAALLGKDPRGGAMALLLATEMAGLQ